MAESRPVVEIRSVERFGSDELLSELRQTRLRGFDGARPYADAQLSVETVDTDQLTPAQNYVMTSSVAVIAALRAALLPRSIDIFRLDGGVRISTADDPDDAIPVIPPIIEESHEPDGRTVLLISDGMHRVFAARAAGLPISVVLIRNVPARYPYYAFALPDGWAQVEALDTMPEGRARKRYRTPDDYRALYRDFNARFPGVQKDRWRPVTSQ